jgi:hypothetical protein
MRVVVVGWLVFHGPGELEWHRCLQIT